VFDDMTAELVLLSEIPLNHANDAHPGSSLS
jgi:hypothetical protein